MPDHSCRTALPVIALMIAALCLTLSASASDADPQSEPPPDLAAFLQEPGLEVSSPVPGCLFFPDDPVRLTLSVRTPPSSLPVALSCEIRQPLADDPPVQPLRVDLGFLSPQNDYRADVDLPIRSLGYYELVWHLACRDRTARFEKTNLALIPPNPQESQRWDSPFGVNVHFAFEWPKTLAPVVQRLGIAWIRDHMNTSFYNPDAGQYTAADPTLELAETHRLCFLPLSEYFQRSEKGRLENGRWLFPAAARQVQAYARRHRGRIRHFELYNEPPGFGWGQQFDPGGVWWQGGKWVKPFTDFGIAQTRALHRGDPNIKMLWQEGDIFLWAKLFAQEGATPDIMQILAPHPYNIHDEYPENQPYVTGMPATLQYLKDNRMTRRIWVTEVGWSTFQPPAPQPEQGVFYRAQTEQQQAQKLARVMILHRATGIAKTFWYDLYDDGFPPENPEYHFGIIRVNPLFPASASVALPNPDSAFDRIRHRCFQPKPAAVAYANVIHWLERARCLGRYDSGGYAYVLQNDSSPNPFLVAWTKRGQLAEEWLVPSRTPAVTVTSLFGAEQTLPVKNNKLNITLTESPVFITGLTTADLLPRTAK